MASNRYRNRAGSLKPETWHNVKVVKNGRVYIDTILLRPLETFLEVKARVAKEYGARLHDVTVGKVVHRGPVPRSSRVVKLLQAAIADATAGRFSANPPDLDQDDLFDYALEEVR